MAQRAGRLSPDADFPAGCRCRALAVAMVSFLPRLWHRSGRVETNADWLMLRQKELEGDAEALKQDAALRVVEEGDVSPDALDVATPQYVWWVQCLGAALLIAGTGWLYRRWVPGRTSRLPSNWLA